LFSGKATISLNVFFAGTPEFAARCLAALLESRHRVVGAFTQPDRPAGRGQVRAASPVKRLALARGIPLEQPESLREESVCEQLRRRNPDVMVVAAYGLILPQAMLDIARLGAYNVHASLLPRWRGAAPIERALLAGDRNTGISIMQMNKGLDTGPVLLQEEIAISETDTAGTLHDRLAGLGGQLIVRSLDSLQAGQVNAKPQPSQGASYAAKLDKREARLDWRESAVGVNRRIRAFNPSPGASARIRGVDLKIWECIVAPGGGAPGEVLGAGANGVLIACGEGAVLASEMQRAGGRRLAAAEFLAGFALTAGERFEAREST
jgi:methionyl-tRNA formyltransferase